VTEEQIILLVGCGKPRERDAGVRALYELMGSPMLRFFVHLGVPAEEARDLLQETFVKILRAAYKFKPGGSAKAWLWQIARNCLNDHLRESARLRRHEAMFDDEQWNTVKDTVPAKAPLICSVDECVAQGIARFSADMPDRAFALTLQMEGASIQDIADRIGRTAAATKEYLSQSRKKLQPFIAHCTELLVAKETS
jgi:RNA polymerase sigma-70 factor (ECF subfamily)